MIEIVMRVVAVTVGRAFWDKLDKNQQEKVQIGVLIAIPSLILVPVLFVIASTSWTGCAAVAFTIAVTALAIWNAKRPDPPNQSA